MEQNLAQGLVIKGAAGPGMKISGPMTSINSLSDLVGRVLSYLIPLAGVILFLIIIWGGYNILMSQGNPEKLQEGRQKITAGIIGFVLLVCSFFIARLIGFIFGVGEGIL